MSRKNVSKGGVQLLQLARFLLDDDYGINPAAWIILRSMLVEAGLDDLVNTVRCQDGRYYLPEGD